MRRGWAPRAWVNWEGARSKRIHPPCRTGSHFLLRSRLHQARQIGTSAPPSKVPRKQLPRIQRLASACINFPPSCLPLAHIPILPSKRLSKAPYWSKSGGCLLAHAAFFGEDIYGTRSHRLCTTPSISVRFMSVQQKHQVLLRTKYSKVKRTHTGSL